MTLHAMATAYDQAMEDAGVAEWSNPYQSLLDDRRGFIRDALEPGYGTLDDDGLPDDLLDDLLDAHDDWLAQQLPCSAQFTIVHVDSKAADSAPCVRPGGHTGGHETETGRTWPQAPAPT